MKFKEELIEVIEHSEIDFHYPHWTEGEEEPNDVDYLNNTWSETVSIDLDLAISTLNKLKEKGATQVYLYAHADHIGYIITGVKYNKIEE